MQVQLQLGGLLNRAMQRVRDGGTVNRSQTLTLNDQAVHA